MKDENAILAYYQKIVNGGVIVGRYIRLLYEVIIEGLESQRWFYDQRLAENAIRFIETYCHHYKGRLAPQRIRLSLWQRASISLIFGIVNADGKRQFTEVFWLVGRKQGKTLLAGAIGTYMAYAAGEYGSEIYYLAPKIDQADLCFSAFEYNVHAEPELDVITKSTKYRGLVIAETNTTVKKLAFSDRKSDGYNPMFYNADEVAAWPGARGLRQWEVMGSGTGAREEPLGMAISSGGYEDDGLFDELMKRGTAFLNGNSREQHILPILYMIDDPEKWDDISELQKSLPGLGESVSVNFILREIDTAHESISKKLEFLTKYCNLKQNSSAAWFDAATVRKVFLHEDESGEMVPWNLTLDDFADSYALCGLDLSQTTDLTCACVIIERDGILWLFAHFWIPADRIRECTDRDGIPYQIMIERGLCSASGDQMIDHMDCFRWFQDLIETYHIYPLMVGYDRWCAAQIVQALKGYGYHVDSVTQGYNLSGIIDSMEGLMRAGRLRCADNNDLLKIHFMDAALQVESSNSTHSRKKLVKLTKNAHVDGVAAVLDALCMRQVHWDDLGERLQNAG